METYSTSLQNPLEQGTIYQFILLCKWFCELFLLKSGIKISNNNKKHNPSFLVQGPKSEILG